ncbi:hypothetical protein ACNOYE_22860 [Nannocystaceae bacterium ST9]
MYVSIHATTHPIEFAGFLALERAAFACEPADARERGEGWQPDSLTIDLDGGVPSPVVDLDPTRFLAFVA